MKINRSICFSSWKQCNMACCNWLGSIGFAGSRFAVHRSLAWSHSWVLVVSDCATRRLSNHFAFVLKNDERIGYFEPPLAWSIAKLIKHRALEVKIGQWPKKKKQKKHKEKMKWILKKIVFCVWIFPCCSRLIIPFIFFCSSSKFTTSVRAQQKNQQKR